MSNKLELERCPFCGEEAVVEELKEGEYMANCPECGATSRAGGRKI